MNKDKDNDLKKPLVNEYQMGSFGVSCNDLCSVFEPDNIKDSKSIEILKNWGKYEGLEQKIKTSRKLGISLNNKADHADRVKAYGSNESIHKPPISICELITEQFEDKILRILILAAVVSTVIGVLTEGLAKGWLEGTAILAAVVIIVGVTATNNYLKEKQFRKLYAKAETRNVNVIREGQVTNISVFDLLVGDVMEISTGEILPVDGILFDASNMLVDESSITGESDSIKKKVPKTFQEEKMNPFLISGSKVMEGQGYMIVCGVGVNSQNGKLKLTLQESDDTTPLQEKLNDLADDIGRIGMTVAGVVFVGMLLHLVIEKAFWGHVSELITLTALREIVEYFIIAVTMIVVSVPEGLPLAVTIALAYSVGKMKDENNLVRFLQACETMGGANNICSDKTGTLTTNKMTVTRLYGLNKVFTEFSQDKFPQDYLEKLCVGVCVNSTAYPKVSNEQFEEIGNKTECALLKLGFSLGFDFQKYRPNDRLIKQFPFSSEKKKMSSIWKLNEGTVRIFTKGAPDYLIPKCSQILISDQDKLAEKYVCKPQKFVAEDQENMRKTLKKFAQASLRTLILAYRDINSNQVESLTDDDIDNDLTIVALVGIKDPLRPGIPEAVQTCRTAGITVRMITGDIQETAVAIAKEAGILDKDFDLENNYYQVMQGKDFRKFVGGIIRKPDPEKPGETKPEIGNIQNFEIVATNLKVMARSTPEDKFTLIVGLKQLGHVVAVTGDGTNDAPALKKADVGFAMGIAGTEVAKEASGIILLDDNFKSIITAIKYGRNIFDCIRKFLQFQLTINVVAMFMVFFGGVILLESPLNAIQMLWVNLIMDTLASLALATEPPSDELLKRKPYSRNEYMITPVMWRNIIGHAIYQIILLLVVLFFGPQLFQIPSSVRQPEWNEENGKHYTILFNIFVQLQVFNQINARKLKKEEINVFKSFCNNPLFFIVMVVIIVIQYLLVQHAGQAVRCAPLSIFQHLICIGIGTSSLIIGFLIKQLPEGCFSSIKLFRDAPHIETSEEDMQTFKGMMAKPTAWKRESQVRKYSKQSSQQIREKQYIKKNSKSFDSGGHSMEEKKIEIEAKTYQK